MAAVLAESPQIGPNPRIRRSSVLSGLPAVAPKSAHNSGQRPNRAGPRPDVGSSDVPRQLLRSPGHQTGGDVFRWCGTIRSAGGCCHPSGVDGRSILPPSKADRVSLPPSMSSDHRPTIRRSLRMPQTPNPTTIFQALAMMQGRLET